MSIIRPVIKALIFDCFGVLTTDKWKAFVDGLPPEIDKGKLRELNRQLDTGFLDRSDFSQQVFELTGSRPQEVESLLNNEVAKNLELLKLIGEKRATGMKVGLLSNVSSDWVTKVFLDQDELALFDVTLMSYEVGIAKPDPRIFEIMCSRLGANPEESVMIDDASHNCAGAESLGMKTILYTDLSSFQTEIEQLLTDSND